MEWISLLGVIVALFFFIYLSYKGYNLIAMTILASVITAITGGLDPVATLNGVYLGAFSGFIKSWFLIFVFSAIFAKMMDLSGAARAIAYAVAGLFRKVKDPNKQKYWAIMMLPIINVPLVYGGISSLVSVFIVVSIAKDLFEELDIPWHFYGIGALGSATFVMGSLPGSPDAVNLSAIPYLGTTPMAAPGLGIIASLIMWVLGMIYLKFALAKNLKTGEGFLPTGAAIKADAKIGGGAPEHIAPFWKGILPPVVMLLTMNALNQPVILAMFAGMVTVVILFPKEILPNLKTAITAGVPTGAVTACMLSTTIAFGRVVASVPAYNLVVGGLDAISAFLPPAFQVFVCVNITAALTSSGNSAVAIVLEQFTERFLEAGIPAEAIHRIATTTALGLNTLPHSVGVVNAAGASRLTIKQIYPHYLWITVIFPIIASFVITLMTAMGIVF